MSTSEYIFFISAEGSQYGERGDIVKCLGDFRKRIPDQITSLPESLAFLAIFSDLAKPKSMTLPSNYTITRYYTAFKFEHIR
jgi:hypothetical protein